MSRRSSSDSGGKSFDNRSEPTDSVEIKAGLCNADPITKHGKRIQMAQMLCIPLAPIILLIVQTFLSLANSVATKNTMDAIAVTVRSDEAIDDLVSALAAERAAGCDLVFAGAAWNFTSAGATTATSARFAAAANATDRLLAAGGFVWPPLPTSASTSSSTMASTADPSFQTAATLAAALVNIRRQIRFSSVAPAGNMTELNVIKFYGAANTRLLDIVARTVTSTDNGAIWKMMLVYRLLLQANEMYAVVFTLGGIVYGSAAAAGLSTGPRRGGGEPSATAASALTVNEYETFVESYSLAMDDLIRSLYYWDDFVAAAKPFGAGATAATVPFTFGIDAMVQPILTGSVPVASAATWTANFTAFTQVRESLSD